MIATLKPVAFWARTHSVHYLSQDDIPRVQALLERCQEFWWITEGRGVPADAASANFTATPPNYELSRIKFLGVYNPARQLVGFLSTPPDFPQQGDWYIGLMVLDPDSRGNGLGEAVYRGFEEWVASAGGQRILLAVVDDNPRGRTFWERMGFTPLRVVPPRVHGVKTQGMVEMVRRISSDSVTD